MHEEDKKSTPKNPGIKPIKIEIDGEVAYDGFAALVDVIRNPIIPEGIKGAWLAMYVMEDGPNKYTIMVPSVEH